MEKSKQISFKEFAKEVYPFLEFTQFHKSYYSVLEAYAEGRISKLIVSVPPQHGKSMGATTLLPAYMLGIDPDMRIAIASYSGTLASKFNRRVQRILDSKEYSQIFPDTTIKQGVKPLGYIRTSDEVEIIGHKGELISVGREGALTGNRVDCFILDDLYKDAMEAQSPVIRDNCCELHSLSDIDAVGRDEWLVLNYEALKASPATELDPRSEGEALWPQQQSAELLKSKRRLDPVRFDAMYQGHPSSREGLLYGNNFREYDKLPRDIVTSACYTDTADAGDDYLCSVAYSVDTDGVIYVTDVVYSKEPMEHTESLVAAMLTQAKTRQVYVESNNGGRGFARALQRLLPKVKVEWFHQSGNKEARILSNSATVLHNIRMPKDWHLRWPEFYAHLTTYRRLFRANRHDDAPDALTGIVEREVTESSSGRWQKLRFL